LVFGEEAVLLIDQCLRNDEENVSICLVELVNDSRCPMGARCVWAGDAMVELSFVKDDTVSLFLHTNREFQRDTTLMGYKVALIDVDPYPSLRSEDMEGSVTATVSVSRID
jgi:hypothetical protein